MSELLLDEFVIATPKMIIGGAMPYRTPVIAVNPVIDTLDVHYLGRVITHFTQTELMDSPIPARDWMRAKIAVFKSIYDGFAELDKMLARWRMESNNYYDQKI